jgi:diguanylate cyclase (GGDEF)-like protein
MELRSYIRVLYRHWRLVLPIFLVTCVATIILTLRQPRVYSSTATFVVAPSAAFQDARSFAAGLETLSRRAEIAATYAEVASSRTVTESALDALGLPREFRSQLAVKGALLAGTNIFRITVEARNPAQARDMANAVGTKTIEYVQTLYEPFVLRPLDPATVRLRSVNPSKPLTILLGAVFGFLLAAGIAFLSDHLRTPLETTYGTSVLDPDIGVYNQGFFMQRLGVEMTRAKRQQYPLSLALLNIDHMGIIRGSGSTQAENEILRKAAVSLQQSLREEDIFSYFGNATFAILFPDVDQDQAYAMVEKLQTRLAWNPIELARSGSKVNFTTVAGVATLDHNEIDPAELIADAERAMRHVGSGRQAEESPASNDPITSREQPADR